MMKKFYDWWQSPGPDHLVNALFVASVFTLLWVLWSSP
jgi:hypothetical protein